MIINLKARLGFNSLNSRTLNKTTIVKMQIHKINVELQLKLNKQINSKFFEALFLCRILNSGTYDRLLWTIAK